MTDPRATRHAPKHAGWSHGAVVLLAVVAMWIAGCASERASSGTEDEAAAVVDRTEAVPSTTHAEAGPQRDGRRRVLFVGDSLMFQASDELADRFGANDVETRFIGYPGTGLLSGQGWWNREISAQVQAWQPDVVVIEACCNYSHDEPKYELPDGSAIVPDSEAMYRQWAKLAANAVDRAGRHGAEVFWVTTPAASVDEEPEILTRIDRFNRISAALDATQLDWRSVLTPDGTYTQYLEVGGVPTQVRSADGLHVSDAGNVLLADATWEAVAPALGPA